MTFTTFAEGIECGAAAGFIAGALIMRALARFAVDAHLARAMAAEQQLESFKESIQRIADTAD